MVTELVLQHVTQVGDDWVLAPTVPPRLMTMLDEADAEQAVEITTDIRMLEAFFVNKGAHQIWEKLREVSRYGIDRIVRLKQNEEVATERKSKDWQKWAQTKTAPQGEIVPSADDRSVKSLLAERGLLGGPRPRNKK